VSFSFSFPALSSALGLDRPGFSSRKEDWQVYWPTHNNSKSINNCFAYNDSGALHCFCL